LPASCNKAICSSQASEKHRGICPEGWHIPSNAEWATLADAVGGASTAGTILKADSDLWNGNGKGTDGYGFSALPGGIIDGEAASSQGAGDVGIWWTSSNDNSTYVYCRRMFYNYESVTYGGNSKLNYHSIRCVKD